MEPKGRIPLNRDEPLVRQLDFHGIEMDQKLHQAVEMAMFSPRFNDSTVFHALSLMNVLSSRLLSVDSREQYIDHRLGIHPTERQGLVADLSYPYVRPVLEEALAVRSEARTLGAGDFVLAVVRRSLRLGDSFFARPFTADFLSALYSEDATTPLSEIPEVQQLLKTLVERPDRAEDFQYVLGLEENRLRFRIVSTVDDYVQVDDSGLWVPHRTLLTHLEKYGLFSADQISELEELINDPKAKEAQFQEFFERHPHFLRKWDHREVFPHVYLTREDQGPLIPDFILTNREAQDAAILDLKQARGLKTRLIRHQDNRVRFADAVMEARAQLLQYKDWFDIPDHRRMLKDKVGMEIYRPRLMVVIGRASDFRDELERQQLRDRNPDIEIVTYDDIAGYAQSRRVFIETGRPGGLSAIGDDR